MKQVRVEISKEKAENVLTALKSIEHINNLKIEFDLDSENSSKIEEIMSTNSIEDYQIIEKTDKGMSEVMLETIADTFPEKISSEDVLRLLKLVYLSKEDLSNYEVFEKFVEEDIFSINENSILVFIRGYYFNTPDVKQDVLFLLKSRWEELKTSTTFPQFIDLLFDISVFYKS